ARPLATRQVGDVVDLVQLGGQAAVPALHSSDRVRIEAVIGERDSHEALKVTGNGEQRSGTPAPYTSPRVQRPTALVTGSGGLIGSESVRYFSARGFDVIGIENDMRAEFFGATASTRQVSEQLADEIDNFRWLELDIRDRDSIEALFAAESKSIELVVHCA